MPYYFKEIAEGSPFYPYIGETPFERAPAIDRTGLVDNSISILTAIPPLPTTEIVLGDVVEDRAKELLSKSQVENKELRVAWSGGVDSTLVLSAIIKNKIDYPNADVKICLNQNSIRSNVSFYNQYIKNILDVYESNFSEKIEVDSENLANSFSKETGKEWFLVTGECGDQITAPKNYKTSYSNEVLLLLKPILDARPAGWGSEGIDRACWFKLVLLWQWSQVRMSLMYGIHYDKIEHFFDNDAFQQWWLQTPPSERYEEEYAYKPEFQEYIRGFTGGELELGATDSLPVTAWRSDTTNWVSLDTSFNRTEELIVESSVIEISDGNKLTIEILNATLSN